MIGQSTDVVTGWCRSTDWIAAPTAPANDVASLSLRTTSVPKPMPLKGVYICGRRVPSASRVRRPLCR